MNSQLEQKIRERAYELWVRDGHIPGKADDYWYQAEQEIRSEAGLASDDASGQSAGSGLAETSATPEHSLAPLARTAALSEGALPDAGAAKTRKKRAPVSPKPDDAGLASGTTPRRKRSVQTP